MLSALPVTDLEGVGPASATALATISVHSVADVIRASAEHMHSVVSHASIDTVREWRAMALLMEVDQVTAQWAEALAKGGVASVETLRRKTPTQLVDVFAAARDANTIPDVPSAEQVVAMILDATEIHFTGRMCGTVRKTDGAPVAGAQVSCGGVSTVTDTRGRFRLIRIPLGATLRLRVEAQGYQPLSHDNPRVTRNDSVVDIQGLVVEAATPGFAEARLSEYEGERLPPLVPDAMTTEARTDALRDGDVLVVHRFYQNGDAQLVSKFIEYEAGRFFALHWRVPVADFPSTPGPKSVWRYRKQSLIPLALTPSKLAVLKAQRRRKAAFANRPTPETRVEWDTRRAEMAAFMSADLGMES